MMHDQLYSRAATLQFCSQIITSIHHLFSISCAYRFAGHFPTRPQIFSFAMPPCTETHYCLCIGNTQWQLCRFIAQHPSFCSFIWHSPSPSVSTVVHHNCSPCPRDDLIPNLYRYLYCPKWKLKDCSSSIIVLFLFSLSHIHLLG